MFIRNMYILFKALLFIASNVGIWELLRRKTKIDILFIPSLTVALQVCALFAAGILNILYPAAIVIWIFGILFIAYIIIREKNIKFLKHYCSAGYIYLLIIMLFSAIVLRNRMFTHFDNFTHWGLVSRTIIENNRFPTFRDTFIDFQAYPVGSASFIYYFSKITFVSEPVQMLAQVYMMTVSVMPVFKYLKGGKAKQAAGLVCAAGFTCLIFAYNIKINNLLVDTLLPLAAVCGMLYVYTYCLNNKDRVSFFLAGAYLTCIMQIKNSGTLFVAIAVLWILFRTGSERKISEKIAVCAVPAASYILWHAHCSLVFENAEMTKHAMSPALLYYQLRILSSDTAFQVLKKMAALTFTHDGALYAFSLMLLIGFAFFLLDKRRLSFWKKGLAVSAVLYFVYQSGTYLMYVLSMPEHEALSLAGSDRYIKTIVIVLFYNCLIMLITLLSDIKNNRIFAAAAIVSAAVPWLLCCALGTFSVVSCRDKDDPETTWMEERAWLEEMKEEYDIPEGKSYCILVDNETNYKYNFTYWVSLYVFRSTDVTCRIMSLPDTGLDDITEEYVLIYNCAGDETERWIEENYPDSAGKSVIRITEAQTETN